MLRTDRKAYVPYSIFSIKEKEEKKGHHFSQTREKCNFCKEDWNEKKKKKKMKTQSVLWKTEKEVNRGRDGCNKKKKGRRLERNAVLAPELSF
ncbi:hypothetical protein CEXT_653751 [Caerostris extrusa]|uniref:Uncharacterized protein n=1 Tax=Caerostris extrusa TaxID=172846 RepID=A0AAV4NEH8_CAEEX|nr:hypothetical protein CEXT_653751 [Caerostris extrusa]